MADEKKDKKSSDGSIDFFLNFMKKRKEQDVKPKVKKEDAKTEQKTSFKTTLLEMLFTVIDAINHIIEGILMDDRKSKWLSLLMAAILFITVNGATITSNSERTVEDVPVEILNLDESLSVTGVPETVQLKLSGNIVYLQSAIYKDDFKAYIDFSGYTEGSYTFDVKVDRLPGGITASVSPSTVNASISKKESRVFALGYKYINENQKDAKYVLEPPTLPISEVTVISGRETLDSIRHVQAVIDVKGVTSTFTQKAVIKAYDEYGRELLVEVEPESVDVSVSVTSSSKQVPIKVSRVGIMPEHLAISSITVDPVNTTIYGQKAILEDIEAIFASVDISEIYEDKEIFGVSLELPTGVRSSIVETVNVTIKVEERLSKIISDTEIKVQNNTDNRKVEITEKASIQVSGAISRITSLDDTSIQAFVDVSGLAPGEYEIPIAMKTADSLLDLTLLSSQKVKVKIE